MMRRLATILVLIFASGACASGGGDADEDGLKDTHYTLKMGRQKRHPEPLPSETAILVERHDSKGGSRTNEGFRGWDFDGDGRFEMVEVLGEDGKVQAVVYDFDGDGTVDLKKD